MQTLRYCCTLYESTSIRCPLFLDSKNIGKMFGESVFILSILVFAKFNTFCKIKWYKSREKYFEFWVPYEANQPIFLMTLNEIYILSHIELQKQGTKKTTISFVKSPKFAWCNNKWRFWNGKTLGFSKIPDFWKFEWILPRLPVLQSFIRWALIHLVNSFGKIPLNFFNPVWPEISSPLVLYKWFAE